MPLTLPAISNFLHAFEISSFSRFWSTPVVHQADFLHLITLGHHNSSCVALLSVHERKSPNLSASPASLRLHIGLEDIFSIGSALIGLAIQPILLEEIILDKIQRHPSRLSLQLTKYVVAVLFELPVERARLGGAFDATGRGLIDVYMGDFIVVYVLLDMEGDGCDSDSLAREPANALENENGVNIV